MFIRKQNQEVIECTYRDIGGDGALPLLTFPSFSELGFVKHGFTTREGGVSQGIFSSLNLSFTRGDEPSAVAENFSRVAVALGTEYEKFVLSDQTHTVNVRKVTEADAGKGILRDRDYTDVDGLITDVPGLTLSTFYADCVPLFFADPTQKAIGLSHSGWKGTVGRMGAHTVNALQKEFGSDPKDIVCAIGPSICCDCYEVSEDVAVQFEQEFPEHVSDILRRKKNGKFLLDLWLANKIVLTEAGIRPENISVTDICTCCNPDILFSHRASKGKRGNLGAFLCLS